MNLQTAKLSSKGQVVIPISLRQKLNLQNGDKLAIGVNSKNELILRKLPTELEWQDLIKDIPVETVDIDQNGHYDPKKAPDFHDWMING